MDRTTTQLSLRLLFILLCTVLLSVAESIVAGYIAVLLFIFAITSIYSSSKILFSVYLQFFISWVWVSLSLIYIENGGYITEQLAFGEAINSISRSIALYLAFIIPPCFIVARRFKDGVGLFTAQDNTYFSFASRVTSGVIIASLLLVGLSHGFPLLNGIDRFSYWPDLQHFQPLIFLSPVICFCLGFLYSKCQQRQYVIFAFLHAFIVVLFAEKFTGPFLILLYFLTGFFLYKGLVASKSILNFTFILVGVPFLGLALIAVVSYGYVRLHGVDVQDLTTQVINRTLGLQGHVWYGIDYKLSRGFLSPEPSVFFRKNMEPMSPAGLPFLMYEVSPPAFVANLREAGIRFTNGFPAIVVAAFGFFPSLLINILLGWLVSLYFIYLIEKVRRLQFIRTFLALMFFNNIIVNIFIMGEVYYIYKSASVCLILYFLFDACIFKHRGVSFRTKLLVHYPQLRFKRDLSGNFLPLRTRDSGRGC